MATFERDSVTQRHHSLVEARVDEGVDEAPGDEAPVDEARVDEARVDSPACSEPEISSESPVQTARRLLTAGEAAPRKPPFAPNVRSEPAPEPKPALTPGILGL